MVREGAAGWLVWLQESALGVALRLSLYLYPAVEILHVLGIVLLVGAAVLFDLRLLGATRRLSVAETARYLLPWSHRGLALVVLSGLAMFTAHATEWAYSTIFRVKLSLIVVAGLNVLYFHRRTFRSVAGWDEAGAPRAAKVAAVLSIILWAGIIVMGQLLAYFE